MGLYRQINKIPDVKLDAMRRDASKFNSISDDNWTGLKQGPGPIYSGKIQIVDETGAVQGALEMVPNGMKIYNADNVLKIHLGFITQGFDYPFLKLGSGNGDEGTWGLIKKFTDGMWMGNSAPENDYGELTPAAGYNGIFFDFTENRAYIVNGTDIQNIYTGEAIAKFG